MGTTLEFYDNGHGDRFTDSSLVNDEIALFLREEQRLLDSIAGSIDALIEVGCMHGRYLDWAVQHRKLYFGLDQVHRYITAGKDGVERKKLDEKDFTFILSEAEQLAALVERGIINARPERTLALFPFNSFGNMKDPLVILRNLQQSKLLYLISSYQLNNRATSGRWQYYVRCGYKDLSIVESENRSAVVSAEGLCTYSYHPAYLLKLFQENQVPAVAIPFSEIGIAYASAQLEPNFRRRYIDLRKSQNLIENTREPQLDRGRKSMPPVKPAECEGPAPLSYAQQRIWFIEQMDPGSAEHNLTEGLRIEGPLDAERLERSLQEVVGRHDSLRTRFLVEEGEARQVVEEHAAPQVRKTDLSGLPEHEQEVAVQEYVREQSQQSFDLSRGVLLRANLLKLKDHEHVLLLTTHQIISDSWSTGVLFREWMLIYENYGKGKDAPTRPTVLLQYADFVVWQKKWTNQETMETQFEYWRRQLAGVMPLELPTDRPRPAIQSTRGAQERVFLEQELIEPLRQFSRQARATLGITLLAGFKVLLYRYSGQSDITVGMPVSGRTRTELEELIGIFTNHLVMRNRLQKGSSFQEILEKVRQTTLEAHEHQDVPFEKLVEVLSPQRDLSRMPFFQVMFHLRNTPLVRWQVGKLTLQPVQVDPKISRLEQTWSLHESVNDVCGFIEYATDLFEPATIRRMIGHYRMLLAGIPASPDQPVECLPMLTEEECRQILVEWNNSAVQYPPKCVHELFEEQVKRTPAAIAVIEGERKINYAELNREANQLAYCLIRKKIGPEVCVGICMKRGLGMMVALISVMKTGAAYVPLDPAYPPERLKYMIEDAEMAVILSQTEMLATLPTTTSKIICLDSDWEERRTAPEENPARSVGLDNLCYVIYTSGSTGKPKGVGMPQGPVANLIQWQMERCGVDHVPKTLQFTSLSFDVSFQEIFATLCAGGTMILISEELRRDPIAMWDLLEEQEVERLFLPFVALQQLANTCEVAQGKKILLREVIAAGEQLKITPAVARMFQQMPQCILENQYGPTESHIITAYKLEGSSNQWPVLPPIGVPMANTRLYVLDSEMQVVPVGVAGELYLGGEILARGYLNQPVLTAERFIPEPFSGVRGARMYRTGDQARYDAHGNIEYLGRLDHQVKIRGYRIELGEVETLLEQHPGVRGAAVTAREDGAGNKRLIAYYTFRDAHGHAPEAKELRKYLIEKLPEYMVPAAYMRLESFPLTPSGKVDRKLLPLPVAHLSAGSGYETPVGPAEAHLARIWAEVLHVDQVGRHDNFFELGGHSLLALKVVERARAAGLQVNVRTLFAAPTLSELAASAASDAPATVVPPNRIPKHCEAITPEMLPLVRLTEAEVARIVSSVPGGVANVQDIYPLAPLQEGIFFHHLIAGKGDPYLLSVQLNFESRERLDAYIEAMQKVVDRHDILRTAVHWQGLSEPVQVVLRKVIVPVKEVALSTGAVNIAKQLYERFNPRHYRIDVCHAPLLRVYIAYDPLHGRWLMLQLLHHLLGDHTTLELMEQEIQTCMRGQADTLPAPVPFRNLVAQARLGASEEEHETFFRRLLGDVEEPTAPYGMLNVQGDGTEIEEARYILDDILSQRIREQARRLKVNASSLCHIAWAHVLARISGRDDVVFGTVLFGRMQGENGTERAMGLFMNTLPVRVPLGTDDVETSARRMHNQLVDLLRHEHASLALAQRCSAVTAPLPLFSALLNYRYSTNIVNSTETLQSWESQERTTYPLTLSLDDMGEGFGLTIQAQVPIDPVRICRYMSRTLESLADALENEPSKPVRSLEVLPDNERQQLLYDWNDTAIKYATGLCLHELFEKQAEATPEAIALVHEERELSYQELNWRANRLAHYLREVGVKPDDIVAIMVERGLEMVVAMLGVLKAGGAYLPLDPAYPMERLKYMIADSTPVAVLTQSCFKNVFADLRDVLPVLDVTAVPSRWQGHSNLNPAGTGLGTGHLAYVIYTSGSTGKPKGIRIEHRNAVNFIHWAQQSFPKDLLEQTLFSTSLNFDLAVFECYTPLASGTTVRIMSNVLELVAKPADVSLVNTVPSAMNALLETGTLPASVRTINLAGESLQRSLVERIFAATEADLVCNLYGPSETTTYSTWTAMKWGEPVATHIGRPIANTAVYILDWRRDPVPIGVTGELYIAGAGVARGYLNRPELTAERFVPDPFTSVAGERMYKTGDLGRRLADGNIEFLGRNDSQVKVRGYRIELGEIEARLAEHAGVREAAVLAPVDTEGNRRLVAYVVLDGKTELNIPELREHLRERLPEYMVPGVFIFMDNLPLTPSGKIDRLRLPKPEDEQMAIAAGDVCPRNHAEETLTQMWMEVLGVKRIGITDNFFVLGGHSLLATRVLARVRDTFRMDIPLRAMFDSPTIAEFSEVVMRNQPAPDTGDELSDLLTEIEQLSLNETRNLLAGASE